MTSIFCFFFVPDFEDFRGLDVLDDPELLFFCERELPPGGGKGRRCGLE